MKTLQDYIKLAESASQGPWEDGNEAIFTQAHDKGRVWNGTVFLGKCSENILLNLTFAEEAEKAANDARFIAASRTLGPAMAKALIEAEEALKNFRFAFNQRGWTEYEKKASKILSQIQALNGGEE